MSEPAEQLMGFLTGKWVPPVLGVLAELGVADEVAEKPLAADELAERLGVHATALYRVLRAAASVGVFAADDEGRFGLTPTAELLRTGVPGSLRSAAMMFGLEPFWSPYARIAHTVRTGEPAFDQVYGHSIYQYLQENPSTAETFGAAAAGFHGESMAAIAAAHDFSAYERIVDVGGGSGALLVEVLRTAPATRGVLLELESVLPTAEQAFREAGMLDRVELVAGDFFAEVPAGDAYLVKSNLHNFDDQQAIDLLRVVRRGQAPALIVETMIPAGNEPHYSKFDDVEMMVIAGGADRTEAEWIALTTAAGFEARRVVSCNDRFSLLEAIPT
ncbi:acetylserotonin O-methyltransferase [Kribbella sp. NBC_01505]|uniref:methyltransferase n=1 Tax=Kribbella sp. NBC_01505 TaxID=2903580 RepID=UPI00386E81AA